MNPNIFNFALAAIGRMEAMIQNSEAQFNDALKQLQEITAERDALKAELAKLEQKEEK
jgi:cell division protein FtsB